ncbi:hypothetical protein BD410DRAFT_899108 [Rickenella mellea]|uniref:Ricin B lectin domain-containing protein n=1 Tax=Rickenella mellea TaxID=50990 RepID=A0A4Y7Q1K8_9AGAM|nr:hypothetical protein BD410DRAFT_899108 [Rickenella mellea]
MSFDPGTYTIQNVLHRSVASQSSESTVVADADTDSGPSYGLNLRMLWSILLLSNGKYTIKNIGTNDYATSPTRPASDDIILTKPSRQQWVIKETGFKGRHVIYTTAANTDLFWGLADGELLTPISLRNTPNHPGNQWVLGKVSSRKELGEEIVQLRAKLAELEEENRKLRDGIDIQAEIERREHENHQLRGNLAKLQAENTKLCDSVEFLREGAKSSVDRHRGRKKHDQGAEELRLGRRKTKEEEEEEEEEDDNMGFALFD